ncbi:MAG: SDR family oxidoreductase [Candidatus Hodarchaeales archaeon]
MKNKCIVVTGANSGIGKVTCHNLAKMGYKIVMVCRNLGKGVKVQKELIRVTGNPKINLLIADLASFESIRNLVEKINENYPEVDILINNAGTFQAKRRESKNGLELTFAVNYLGPFLLTNLLLPKLIENKPSRIINVSSSLHKNATIDLNDLQSKKRKYKGIDVYATSKLALILFTYALHRKLNAKGIQNVTVNAVHPGFIRTNITQQGGNFFHKYLFHYLIRPLVTKSPEVGAKTSVYLASSLDVESISGKYFVKEKEVPSSPLTYDIDLQDALWDKTLEIVNLPNII